MKKLTLPFLLLAWFVFSCNETNDVFVKPTQIKFGIVETAKDSKLIEALHNVLATKGQKNGRVNTIFGDINIDKALKSEDEVAGITNYSFTVKNSDRYVLKNFILKNDDTDYSGYFILYEPDSAWVMNKTSVPWDKFTGKIKFFNLSGKLISSAKMIDGKNQSDTSNGRVQMLCIYIEWKIVITYPGGSSSYYDMTIDCYDSGGGGDSGTGSTGGSGSEDTGSTGGGDGSTSGSGSTDSDGKVGIYDEENYEIVDIGNLCDNIKFSYVGNSFTAQIDGLGISARNRLLNRVIDAELGTTCIEIPEYHVSDKFEASTMFTNAFNRLGMILKLL